MNITEWRKKIDELDSRLVELLNERARAAREIGRLKQKLHMPIYAPERENSVLENVRKANRGPLPDNELCHVYERIIDVMRKCQKSEAQARGVASRNDTAVLVE